MCTTCGCDSGQTKIEGEHEHTHVHADGTMHSHPHVYHPDEGGHAYAQHEHHHHGQDDPPGHLHEHVHADGTRHAHGPAHGLDHAAHDAGDDAQHAHAAGLTPVRKLRIERDILGANNAIAARNRHRFEESGIFALNLVSSPGAGKTTLLVETIRRLGAEWPLAVIEGDQQTSVDAERIRATGVRALQVNTGKGCHLDAAQVERAVARLSPAEDSLLFIENVGNLVCPSAFDLGEAHKVVVLSVTEGDDKPLKYPDMFAASSALVLNKIDLLPHVEFDLERAIGYARRVRPGIEVLRVSAKTGEGIEAWLAWIRRGAEAARERRRDNVARLKRRIAELEALVAHKR